MLQIETWRVWNEYLQTARSPAEQVSPLRRTVYCRCGRWAVLLFLAMSGHRFSPSPALLGQIRGGTDLIGAHASVARTLGRRARAAAWREGPRMSMASARARPAPCAVPMRPGRYTICTEPLQIFPHDPLNWIPNFCIRTSCHLSMQM